MIGRFAWLMAGWLLAASVAGAQTTTPDEPPMPALSRSWTASDYEVVAAAIVQGRVPLPKFGAGDSDALMRRLVSEENLEFQANQAIPPHYRLQDFAETVPSLAAILNKYLENGDEGDHAELAAVLSFTLRQSGSGAALLSEVIPTIPKDAAYEQRMKALDGVRSGVTDILLGAEMSLGEAVFSAEDKSLILDAMADSIGSLQRFLADDVKAELAQKLQARKGAGSKSDAENFDRVLQALGS